MGGGSKTTTTVTTSPEEKAYQKAQTDLAIQQLALTTEEHGWQSEIYHITKPLLEKYALMTDQQYAEYNSPEAAALRGKYAQYETAQLDSALRNQPIQDELLQRQLDDIRRGGRATDEQKALIGEITNRALQSGQSDIQDFLHQGLGQIRNELAPSRGMRPDDAPIIDEGEKLAMEALRQGGQLTSNLRGAQANAELNFPLNASQLYGAQNQSQQQLQSSMSQFLANLRQQATANRSQFSANLFTAPMSAGEQRIGLINASRPTPVSFARNETTKTSSGGSGLGAIGGILQGVAAVAPLFMASSKNFKGNIKPIGDGQHILSPGALKTNKEPVGGPPRLFDGNLSSGPSITGDLAGDAPINPGRAQGPNVASDEDMLKRIAGLPISTWNYKPETGLGGETHIGPMAEDFNTKIMGKGPEPLISTVDALGSLQSAVKALEARTRSSAAPQQPQAVGADARAALAGIREGGGFFGQRQGSRNPMVKYPRLPGHLTRGFKRRVA